VSGGRGSERTMVGRAEAATEAVAPPAKRPRLAPPPAPLRRPRLPEVSSLEQAVEVLRRARRVVALVGAGISVSCGVPDFRSPNGLYALAERLGVTLGDPQELFDIEAFDDDPTPFYSFAHALWPRASVVPSLTHRFLAALGARKKLLRVYTQNIDGLERRAGVRQTAALN
jgi:NAD-dependent SIR2 family protein deacetylase